MSTHSPWPVLAFCSCRLTVPMERADPRHAVGVLPDKTKRVLYPSSSITFNAEDSPSDLAAPAPSSVKFKAPLRSIIRPPQKPSNEEPRSMLSTPHLRSPCHAPADIKFASDSQFVTARSLVSSAPCLMSYMT